MRHQNVLVFTNSTTDLRILNWNVSTVNHIETAIEALQLQPYKVVAMSKEISKTDQLKLRALASILCSEVILVAYTDEASLSETVISAYKSQKKPRNTINYLDNSFEIALANSLNFK